MMRLFLGLGGLFGFLSVALGAFAAHGLKGRLAPDQLDVFHTGVQYQMYHALALILTALLLARIPSNLITSAGWCFAAGIVLFSGSLYALSVTQVAAFGPITPLGGLAFLAGWALLFIGAISATA